MLNNFDINVGCAFDGLSADGAIALVSRYIQDKQDGKPVDSELVADIEEYYGESIETVISILTV